LLTRCPRIQVCSEKNNFSDICVRPLNKGEDLLVHAVQLYRSRLSSVKRHLVPRELAVRLDGLPGLIAHKNKEVIGAVVWSLSRYGSNTTTAQFYAEAPAAPFPVILHLFEKFSRNAFTRRSNILFELWLPHGAKAHQALHDLGFLRVCRRMLLLPLQQELGSVLNGPIMSLPKFVSYKATLKELASLLKAAYRDTVDSVLYRHLRSIEGCMYYLRAILASRTRPLDPDSSLVYLADRRSRHPVGFTACYPFGGGRFVYMDQLAVHPDNQRRGIARQLLSEIAERTRGSKFSRMYLTVTEENAPAQGLYRDFGFRKVSAEAAYFMDFESQEGT